MEKVFSKRANGYVSNFIRIIRNELEHEGINTEYINNGMGLSVYERDVEIYCSKAKGLTIFSPCGKKDFAADIRYTVVGIILAYGFHDIISASSERIHGMVKEIVVSKKVPNRCGVDYDNIESYLYHVEAVCGDNACGYAWRCEDGRVYKNRKENPSDGVTDGELNGIISVIRDAVNRKRTNITIYTGSYEVYSGKRLPESDIYKTYKSIFDDLVKRYKIKIIFKSTHIFYHNYETDQLKHMADQMSK